MPGVRTTRALSGGDIAVRLDELVTAVGVTDWVLLTGRVEVQCTGVATAATVQLERSTADPAAAANPAPLGAPVNGNPAAGMPVVQHEIGGAAWLRVRVTALTGASVAIALNGRGVATPAAIAQDRSVPPRLGRLRLSTTSATGGAPFDAQVEGRTAGSELRLIGNPGGRWTLSGTTLSGRDLRRGIETPVVREDPGTTGALSACEMEFRVEVAHDPNVPAIVLPTSGRRLILALAATRGLYPGQTSGGAFSNGVETSETTQAAFRAGPDPIPAGTMRAVYVNSMNRPGEVSGTNPVRTKGAFRLGEAVPLPASELTTVPIDGLGVLPLPGQPDVAGRTNFFVRSYVEVDPGGRWPLGRPLLNTRFKNMAGTGFGEGSNRASFGWNSGKGVYTPPNPGSDQIATTSLLTSENSYANGWAPSAILGMVPADAKRGLIIADSIGVGSGDTPEAYEDRSAGFLHQTLARMGIPYINVGVSSDGLWAWLSNRSRRVAFIELCRPNFVINELITNTLGDGATYSSIADGGLIPAWISMEALCGGGMPVYQTTCLPRTNRENTAPAYKNDATTRQAVNVWLRDGAPLNPATWRAQPVGTASSATCVRAGEAGHPLRGVIDIAIAVEDLKTGLWTIPGYGDGLHPAQSGHQFIAEQPPLMNFDPEIQRLAA